MEYVSRIDGLLKASLSREDLADDDKQCQHCDRGNLAIWRCRDCSLARPRCRGCMRKSHKENPLHRIEQWNGHFYRPADLWEVGTYLLVRHHNRSIICDIVKAQEDFLEILEGRKDVAEQVRLQSTPATPATYNTPATSNTPANMSHPVNETPHAEPGSHTEDDIEMSNVDHAAENQADEEFIRYIQELQNSDGSDDQKTEIDLDVEDDIEENELEEPAVNQYLPDGWNAEYQNEEGIGSAQRVMGSYVRVVHTNGIHNIAMISCSCQGSDQLADDLFAARLLPASFERIRTIFTAHLLDYFRLSNLELKASAFQFYHLLQRLTDPLEPSKVANLYREFRRMSRIWRWMKRLKWAGYGNNNKTADKVLPGELSVFCPACPQPGINLPEDWLDDILRYWFIK